MRPYLKAYQAQKAVHDQEARMQLMVAWARGADRRIKKNSLLVQGVKRGRGQQLFVNDNKGFIAGFVERITEGR